MEKFTHNKAIQLAVKFGDLEMAVGLKNSMVGNRMKQDSFPHSVMMSGFCKESRLDDFRKLFDEMSERRVAGIRLLTIDD